MTVYCQGHSDSQDSVLIELSVDLFGTEKYIDSLIQILKDRPNLEVLINNIILSKDIVNIDKFSEVLGVPNKEDIDNFLFYKYTIPVNVSEKEGTVDKLKYIVEVVSTSLNKVIKVH